MYGKSTIIIFQLLSIIALTLASRALPRWVRPWARDSDTYFHLLAAQRLRDNHFHPPGGLQGLLIPGPYSYPPLFHYFLAFFPRAARDRLEPYLGSIFDSVQVLLIYAWVFWLSGLPEFTACQLDRAGSAWLASLVFINCPLLFAYGSGPRAFMGTGRPLAELFISMALMGGSLFYLTGHAAWTLGLVLPAALAILTGAFAFQVLVAFSIVLALFLKSWFFLVLPLLTVILSLAISRGHYWRVLRDGLAHSKFYATTLIKFSSWVKSRGAQKPLRAIFQEFRQHPAQALKYLYMDNQYTSLLIKFPWLILGLYLAVFSWPLLWTSKVMWYLLAWSFCGFAAFLLTSQPKFLFLGEAERYVNYTVAALAAMISLMLMVSKSIVGWWLFLSVIIFSFFQLILSTLIVAKLYPFTQEQSTREVSAFLNHQNKSKYNILCIPSPYLSFRLAYETKHNFLEFAANYAANKDTYLEFNNKECGWPNDDLNMIIMKYNINLIIVMQKQLKKSNEYGIKYDFSQFHMIYKNDYFNIYRI